ncbi:hypothetical protein GCM10010228_00940 [Streptomyces massasporeus]|nr:hypothetical protein GCM10010228_00940 [Streptomyces massasporeus]
MPACARRTAVARPMPESAPVITATLLGDALGADMTSLLVDGPGRGIAVPGGIPGKPRARRAASRALGNP